MLYLDNKAISLRFEESCDLRLGHKRLITVYVSGSIPGHFFAE